MARRKTAKPSRTPSLTESNAPRSSGQVARSSAALFGAAVLVFVLLSAGRQPVWGDAVISFEAARTWLRTGHLALPDTQDIEHSAPGPDGKRYSKYPLMALLESVPEVLVVRVAGVRTEGPWVLAMTFVPAVWMALLCLGVALLLARLGLSWRASMVLTVALLVGTPLWVYSRSYLGENSQAALLVWLLFSALVTTETKARGWAILTGILGGLLFDAKPLFALVLPLVAFALPRRRVGEYLFGLLPGVIAYAAYNTARFGVPWAFGYSAGRDGALGFGTPLFVGLFGNLASPGKSIFLYAPLLAAAPFGIRALVDRNRRFWLLAWAAPIVVVLLAVSRWWAWSGDWAWGPRLIVPLIPLISIPALLLALRGVRMQRVLATLAGCGVLVQLPAVLLPATLYLDHVWKLTGPAMKALASKPDAIPDDMLFAHYVPWLSPIAGQWWLLSAKILGPVISPPWTSNGFDSLGAVPPLPPWNFWFNGSLGSWIVLVLGFALLATLMALLMRTSSSAVRPD
jgi:hypothetical protein